MPLFSRTKVLVWRAGIWQVAAMDELVVPDDPRPLSTAQMLQQLDNVPKSMLRQCFCVLLPIDLARVYSSEVDLSLPKDLLPFAAQTFADEKEFDPNSENVVSFWLSGDSTILHYAVMSSTLLEDIRLTTRLPLYSEALITQGNSVSALKAAKPFVPSPQDFLAHQEHRKAMRRLLFGGGVICVSTLVVTQLLYRDVPNVEPSFSWPWEKPTYQQQAISEALTYIRALPPSVRLDLTRVTNEQVIVEVTGLRMDLESWEDRWPSDLPSLTLMVSPPMLEQGRSQ